jgi:hypothetical protein
MIRVLIIGRSEQEWRERIDGWAPSKIECDGARLPASGLRKFEATPPDALIVVEQSRAQRAATLVDAVRERPVGQLIPIVVIAPPAPEDYDVDAEVDAWFEPSVDLDDLRDTLADVLGEDLEEAESSSTAEVDSPDASPGPSESGAAGGDYILEELDEFEEYEERPRRMNRSSIFAGSNRDRGGPDTRVDEESVRRKLKQVRHEDYFVILGVRRGASTQAIREAFHRLFDAYQDQNLPFEVAHEMSDEVAEIRDALEDAWAVLGDASLRQDYIEHTTRK